MTLPFRVSKSRVAFLFSAQTLAEMSLQLYFWTFTWAEDSPPLPFYRSSWNRFTVALRRYAPTDFAGLRVWEKHPGGHGLHVHMLTNKRLNVKLVRVLATRAGIGRIHVRRAGKDDPMYCAKYMTKKGRISGVKQWAALGNWPHTRVASVEVDSEDARMLRQLYNSPAIQALPKARRWREVKRLHLQLTIPQRILSEFGAEYAARSKENRACKVKTVWSDGTVSREKL